MNDSTRAAQIAQLMSSMGFLPSRSVDTRYVEYHKDYAEPHGRVARCTVLFNKGGVIANMDHAKLDGFVVTVQGQVDPVVEYIKDRAPRVMHEDMFRALQVLEGITSPTEAVELVSCHVCANDTADFIVSKEGNIVCPDCRIKVISGEQQGQ